MTNETSGKVQYADFIKLPIIMVKGEVGGLKEYISGEVRINPTFISSYVATYWGENKNEATCVYVGGVSYYVDMPIDKFDNVIKNSDRSLSLDFVENT